MYRDAGTVKGSSSDFDSCEALLGMLDDAVVAGHSSTLESLLEFGRVVGAGVVETVGRVEHI
ncbi:uncharacterized protein N7525_003801 [Penicillium rubens]|uniref:uncharacterized protein n=1 Tax=Penicillium rubens TaxID=1108849 RepID=UPI002A5A3CE1|nr:uncharacterized protein N7525_003801 [Penicillium rubens]KAJ5838613.1 hypothetical protein N7525_003801 [Penicillium rubens]